MKKVIITSSFASSCPFSFYVHSTLYAIYYYISAVQKKFKTPKLIINNRNSISITLIPFFIKSQIIIQKHYFVVCIMICELKNIPRKELPTRYRLNYWKLIHHQRKSSLTLKQSIDALNYWFINFSYLFGGINNNWDVFAPTILILKTFYLWLMSKWVTTCY